MLATDIAGRRIEYRLIPGPARRDPVVLLHEGLGSAALWRDFPDKLARRLARPALAYSRFGYGGSDGLDGPRTPRFMHEEALEILPGLLDRLGIERPLLVGHSDGASIALIHAADAGRPVEGVVLMAPHVVIEPVCVESIARITRTYATSDFRARLGRHHARVDDAFLGWSRIWLDPAFRAWSIEPEAARLEAPCLLIQGRDDEYGTMAQLDAIERRARGLVRRLELSRCGHSPHRDQEAAVLDAIAAFAADIQAPAGSHNKG